MGIAYLGCRSGFALRFTPGYILSHIRGYAPFRGFTGLSPQWLIRVMSQHTERIKYQSKKNRRKQPQNPLRRTTS